MIKDLINKLKIKRAFSAKTRKRLYRVFGVTSSLSLSVDETVEDFAKLFGEKKASTGKYLNMVSENIKYGKSLSDSMYEYLPPSELSIIHAGEQNADNQAQSFYDAAYLVSNMSVLYNEFKKTLISTAFKVLFMFGFLIMIGKTAVELLANLEVEELPWFSTALISFGENVSQFWYLYTFLFIVLLSILAYRLPRGFGKLRSWLQYRVFPFTIYRKLNSTSFLISFGALLNNNFSIDEALETLSKTASPYLKNYLELMHYSAENGLDAQSIFSQDLFDPFLQVFLIKLVSINASGIEIKRLSGDELDETKEEFEQTNARINIAMLLLMAVVVLWGLAAFMIPILDTVSNMAMSY